MFWNDTYDMYIEHSTYDMLTNIAPATYQNSGFIPITITILIRLWQPSKIHFKSNKQRRLHDTPSRYTPIGLEIFGWFS